VTDVPVKKLFWWLPRPSKSKYPGSFPLNFEPMLLKLLHVNPKLQKILQPFGGKSAVGDTVDINPGNSSTFVGDAHDLSFIPDSTYDLVLCDPPYSQEESITIYGIKRKLERKKWVSEAARVTKPGGYLALYHRLVMPRPEEFRWEYLISIATRVNHEGRFCAVFVKEGGSKTGLENFFS